LLKVIENCSAITTYVDTICKTDLIFLNLD